MLVRARIELSNAELPTSTRVQFWKEFRRLAESESSVQLLYDPRGAEREVRKRITRHLENYLNEDPYGVVERSFRRRVDEMFGRVIRVKVRGISYGSIDFLFEVLGFNKEKSEDAIVSLLEMYLPDAVNDVFDTMVDMEATATKLGVVEATRAARIQKIVSSTLLLPLGLGFSICYLVFCELTREMDSLKAREDKLITEVSAMFGKLLEQNASLSKTILERAQDENARLKALGASRPPEPPPH